MIKPYLEARWAELPDYRGDLIPVSLEFLESLHARWCVLLRSLGADDLTREYLHPDSGPVTLAANIGTYAWHGHHHMAQIENLGARMGWRMPPQAP